MNLSLTLQHVARHLPARPAVTSGLSGRLSGADTLSYAAFEAQVAAIGGALRKTHGLQPGSRVAIAMENCAEFLPCLYGAWRAGLCAVPLNAKLHPKEMAYIVDNAGAQLVLATPKIAEALTGAAKQLPTIIATGSADFCALLVGDPFRQVPDQPNDEAWLFYTSGTTGRPKGALLSHANLLFMCLGYYADIDFIDDTDTIVHAAPLSHGSGMYGLAHIARGSHNVILPGTFEPADVLGATEHYPNVSMFAAPTMVTRILNAPHTAEADTSNLKCIVYGGAPMYVSNLKRALTLLGPKLFHLYGQGEAPMMITGMSKALHADTAHPDYERRLASAGVARTGCSVRVVDEAGRDLPLGEVGEIITASPCVMAGYWADEAATRRALRDGWLWTGDLGALNQDGFLTIKDRSKDLIISGGSNIYPREIEDVLLAHPAVLETAVVSRPHADWGEEVVAFVVPRDSESFDPAALDALCLANIARFKRPRDYRVVAALPKNNYGKVMKTALRDQLSKDAHAD